MMRERWNNKPASKFTSFPRGVVGAARGEGVLSSKLRFRYLKLHQPVQGNMAYARISTLHFSKKKRKDGCCP